MPIADIDYREYFTEDALEKLAAAFSHYDVDGTGTIGEAELSAIMRKMGRPLTKQHLREVFKAADYDDSGQIEFEEFCVLEITLSQSRPHPALIKPTDYLPEAAMKALDELFAQQDPGGSGAVRFEAVCSIVEGMGSKATREEVGEVFGQADVEGRGELDFDRLCGLWAVVANQRKKCNYREFLSREQVAQFRLAFDSTDGSGKGHIGRGDLDALLKRVGVTARKAHLDWLARTFDADNSGDIDFEEFCVMMLRLRGARRQRVLSPLTFSCAELWREEGFTVQELQQCGFQPQHFRAAGLPAAKLHAEGGLQALALRRAGYSPTELRRGGLGAAELRCCGFSLADLRLAGFSDRVLEHTNRELKVSLSAGDLSLLPQQRPPSKGVGAPVRGAVLSSAGAAQLLQVATCPWQLPPRPMTQMIREHTDWRPKLGRGRCLGGGDGAGRFPPERPGSP